MSKHHIPSLSIAFGTLLLMATMVLHPVGGDIQHLRSISKMAVIAHSLAILSIPVLIFGFLGFSQFLKGSLSTFAFILFSIAGMAAIIAAALNGLVLPSFLARFPDPSPSELEQIKMILSYNSMVNHAFDWILISGFALSVILWSVAIFKSKLLPSWLAIIGIIDGLAGLYAMFSGSLGLRLHDFRYFMFGFALWAILAGICLRRSGKK